MKRLYVLLPLVVAHSEICSAEISTTAEIESLSYIEDQDNGTISQLQIDTQVEFEFANDTNLYMDASLRRTAKQTFKDQTSIRESYLDFVISDFDFRIGQQIIRWGRSDIVNAMDFSRRNFQDPIDQDNEDLGSFAINLKRYFSDVKIEMVLLPMYQASTMPDIGSPWFAKLPRNTETGQSISYEMNDTHSPQSSINNLQSGVRMNAFLSGWDIGISYFDGWNDTTIYKSEVTGADLSSVNIELTPITYRIKKLGMDAAANLGDNTIRTELTYVYTNDQNGDNPLIDDPYAHLVLGSDYRISNVYQGKDLNTIIEYSKQLKTTNIQYTALDFDHIFEDAISVRLNLNIEPIWQWEVAYVYDIARKGYLLRPSLTYSLNDQLSASLSADWLEGSSDSFFGYYKDNKAIRLRVTHEKLFF